ncbi:MAG TPA: sugar efflux transporter [Opitutaceae bacterium]|jgi:SET family sugar efflux transporter-like MFS transporter
MDRILQPIRTLLSDRDLFIVLVCSLLLGLALSFVAPFYSMFGTIEVGMSNWVFGIFMTITSLAGVISSTLLARWSDTHFTRRSVLLIGCLAGALGYGGYAFVRSVFWLTVIGSIGIGISSIVFAQVFAYGREALDRHGIPASEAPLYMNIYRLALSLAWTIGPGMAAWVMIRYSYRGIFLACAFLFVVFFAIVWLYVPARPPNPDARRNPVPLLQLLRRPDILCYFSSFVLVFVCMTMGMMNLPLMILQSLGGREQQVGIAYSVAPFFELPFLFLFGLAAARGGKPVPMIRLGVIIGVAYYLLLSRVQAPWQIYPLQILSAAMIAVLSGIAITFFQNYIPNQPGTATNLYTTANRIGQTAGYLCYGTLATAYGHRVVFLVCAGVCVAAFLLLWLAREEHESTVALPAT